MRAHPLSSSRGCMASGAGGGAGADGGSDGGVDAAALRGGHCAAPGDPPCVGRAGKYDSKTSS
eukprot:2566140-Pyramimonas_sp.AAC.1